MRLILWKTGHASVNQGCLGVKDGGSIHTSQRVTLGHVYLENIKDSIGFQTEGNYFGRLSLSKSIINKKQNKLLVSLGKRI